MVLSDAVIKLQQQLSDKFKIPTFTLKGDISTVPSKSLIGSINVGVGKFGGESLASFRDSLNQSIVSIRQMGGKIGSTTIKRTVQNIVPNKTNADEPKDKFDFSQTFNEGLGSVGELVRNNPTILIIGLGLVALTVLKR